MYVKIPKDSSERIESAVDAALGENFEGVVKAKTSALVDEICDAVHNYVEDSLRDHIKMNIEGEAQRAAGRFMDALVEGDAERCHHFLSLTSSAMAHCDPRKDNGRSWLNYGRDHGAIALRRAMIESVKDQLESELVADLTAERDELRAICAQQKTELVEWRRGEREV